MHLSYHKYPITVLCCLFWSAITLLIILLDLSGPLRVLFGLPIVLFIPGYILVYALFPSKKTDEGIDLIERIALSLGLSLAIVPLIGLGLNYTPWGIRLTPIILSLQLFIYSIGAIAIYRWYKLSASKRFTISIDIRFPDHENKLDKALTIILVASIIIAASLLIYVIVTPKTGEKFTEFYLLGPEGIADNYPRNLSINQNASVIIGIVNHEYKKMNYTVEVWLVNQTYGYNQTINENMTTYHHAWFLDAINTRLNHTPINIEETWQPQWETNYTFSINRSGEYKLAFLLYTTQEETYEPDIDYKDIAQNKFDNDQTDAYRSLHLWLTIND
jgi:uncharacterized membrane protein